MALVGPEPSFFSPPNSSLASAGVQHVKLSQQHVTTKSSGADTDANADVVRSCNSIAECLANFIFPQKGFEP